MNRRLAEQVRCSRRKVEPMRTRLCLLVFLTSSLYLLLRACQSTTAMPLPISQPAFEEHTLWGFGSAAFQVEGSTDVDGRGPSIWDTFTNQPGKIHDGSDARVATDSYNRWQEDIEIMKSLGVNSYRFSISWSRVIPQGGRKDPVNEAGLAYYDQLVDGLLAAGITPVVSLYHWDLPQALDDRYGGWLNKSEIVLDYVRYAELCFERFGGRVKHWFTFNEPWSFTLLGYGVGVFAPGHKNLDELWITVHSVLLAHAHAVVMYRAKFRDSQGGYTSITLNGSWLEPWDDSAESHQAVQDLLDGTYGLFGDPVFFGDYPASVRKRLGDRLPSFTEEEKVLLKGSSDFMGFNGYTTNTCKPGGDSEPNAFTETSFAYADGSEIGTKSAVSWLRDVPWGFGKLATYLYNRYQTPLMLTEFGYAPAGEAKQPVEQAIQDEERVTFYRGALESLAEARAAGVVIKGIFPWTLNDNFEWQEGYSVRFGCVHVDFDTQKRTPKASALYLKEFFSTAIPM